MDCATSSMVICILSDGTTRQSEVLKRFVIVPKSTRGAAPVFRRHLHFTRPLKRVSYFPPPSPQPQRPLYGSRVTPPRLFIWPLPRFPLSSIPMLWLSPGLR